jgi:LysM repeat protein
MIYKSLLVFFAVAGMALSRDLNNQHVFLNMQQACPFIHTVLQGDTLTSIALRYNSSVDEIVRANNISDPNFILIGQNLNIPCPTQPTFTPEFNITSTDFTMRNETLPYDMMECPLTHIVGEGETLESISTRYSVPLYEIFDENRLESTLLTTGQSLTIPCPEDMTSDEESDYDQ